MDKQKELNLKKTSSTKHPSLPSTKRSQRRIFAIPHAKLVKVDIETIGLLHEMHCNKMEAKNEDPYEVQKPFSGGDSETYQWSAPTPSANNIPESKKGNIPNNKIVAKIMNEYVEKLKTNDPDVNSVFHTAQSDKKMNDTDEIRNKQEVYKTLFEEVFSRLTDIQMKEIKETGQRLTK